MMFEQNVRRCADRIISIYQPHLRPIVRGKAKAKVEFGAKVGASIVNGYTYVDHVSWDAYNELLLSAKHRNPHSNSLRHNSSDDSMLVTSPLIHFLLPPVAIQPLLQA